MNDLFSYEQKRVSFLNKTVQNIKIQKNKITKKKQ